MASIEGKFIQFGCWNQGLCTTEAAEAAVAGQNILLTTFSEKVGPKHLNIKF